MAEKKSENKVGKITAREPLLNDEGEQQTWESENGTFYKWMVTIDGKKGSALSKDTDPWWQVGHAIAYTVETKIYKGEEQYSFKGLKKPDPDQARKAHIAAAHDGVPAKEFKSSYNDPVSTARLAMDKAIELAVKYLKLIQYPPESQVATFNPEMIMSVADKFYDWTIKDVADKDSFWLRRGALLNAMDSIDWLVMFYPDPAEKLIVKLFRLAEFYLTAPMAITADTLKAEKENGK